MTEEYKAKVITELLFNGDAERAIYDMFFEHTDVDKELAIDFFHKAKIVYEVFGLKNPFILIETEEFGKTFYSLYDKKRNEYENFKVIEE